MRKNLSKDLSIHLCCYALYAMEKWHVHPESLRIIEYNLSFDKANWFSVTDGEVEDIDLFRKTITVFKSKNKEMRTLPMNQTIFGMLKSRAKVKSIKTDLVFYNKNHAQIDKRFVSLSFHYTARKAKVEDFWFHDLRHTFATRLVQSGKVLYKIQRLLGQKTPSMTQRYAHHYSGSLRDAVEVLDSRVTNQSQEVDNSLKLQ